MYGLVGHMGPNSKVTVGCVIGLPSVRTGDGNFYLTGDAMMKINNIKYSVVHDSSIPDNVRIGEEDVFIPKNFQKEGFDIKQNRVFFKGELYYDPFYGKEYWPRRKEEERLLKEKKEAKKRRKEKKELKRLRKEKKLAQAKKKESILKEEESHLEIARLRSILNNVSPEMVKSLEHLKETESQESEISRLRSMVWELSEQRKKDFPTIKEEEDRGLCTICISVKANIAFAPCGHMCMCEECNGSYESERCPICRTKSQGKIKIFEV